MSSSLRSRGSALVCNLLCIKSNTVITTSALPHVRSDDNWEPLMQIATTITTSTLPCVCSDIARFEPYKDYMITNALLRDCSNLALSNRKRKQKCPVRTALGQSIQSNT